MRREKLVFLLAIINIMAWGCDSTTEVAEEVMPAATSGELPPQSTAGERSETSNSAAAGGVTQPAESVDNDEASNDEYSNEEETAQASGNDESFDASTPAADLEEDEQVGDSEESGGDDGASSNGVINADASTMEGDEESADDPMGDEPEEIGQGSSRDSGGEQADGANGAEPSFESDVPSDDNSETTDDAVSEGSVVDEESDEGSEGMASDGGEGDTTEDGNDQDADGDDASSGAESSDPSTSEPEQGSDNDSLAEGDEDETDLNGDRSTYPDGPFFPDTEVVSDLHFEAASEAVINLSGVRSDANNRVIVVYTGVAWCGSCRVHMAQYGEMLNRLRDRGLAVISVIREDYSGGVANGNFADAYAVRNGFTHDVVADPNGALAPFLSAVRAEQPGAFRISMIIDAETMTLLHMGQISPYTAERLIEPLLTAP